MYFRHREDLRGWVVVSALVVCLGLTIALGWQAYDAGKSHRESAEQVLREYAATAAAQFMTRTAGQINYYGVFPNLQNGSTWRDANPGQIPSVAAMEIDATDRQKQGFPLIRGYFVFDPSTSKMDYGDGVTDALKAALVEQLEERLAAEELPTGRARTEVLRGGLRVSIAREQSGTILGFEIEPKGVKDFFDRALAQGPLLPTLGADGVDNEDIFFSLADPLAGGVYHIGGHWDYIGGVDQLVGSEFGELLSGMTVRCLIQPSARARIIDGGIPASRLPLLAGMLGITSLLLLMSLVQLRRERQLTHLRSDFVSGVSHELRTPLTQIRMFSETLLLGRVRSDGEARKSLEIIDQEARRLAHLVENILQFSRSERGAIHLSPEPVSLSDVVQETVDGFAPVARARGSAIQTTIETRPVANVDSDAIKQVLLNLIDNAVKYGPASQTIIVSLQTHGNCALISVDDEGPGIPQSQRDHIWDRFYRLESDLNTAVGGSGIGLAVVRELVTMQGGSVVATDGSRGRGTRFVVELPTIPPDDDPNAVKHKSKVAEAS